MKEKINAMTLTQLEARAREIDGMELSTLSTDELVAIDEERQYIRVRMAEMRLAAARVQEQRSRVAAGAGNPLGKAPAGEPEKKSYTSESAEYRSGFLKTLLGGAEFGHPLTAEERTAISYVATTTDETYGAKLLVSKTMANEIWTRMEEEHAILGDITMYRTGTILEIAVHTGIVQGDADAVDENEANDDEVNNFITVSLTGQDFSKHVNISYAMAKMAIDAFEPFLINEIAGRLGGKLAAYTFGKIASGYDSTNNAINTAAVKAVAYKDVAGLMALLKNAKGQAVFYARRNTIYNYLVGMVDTTGRPIFQPNAQAGQEGTLIGCPVKVEDAVGANEIYVGYPKNVVGNTIQDIMIESDRDIKKHVITHSGYARYDAKLIQPASFAKLTVKQS
ncbi:MAG: phage major capsid protein [Clostridia bacterium]|nr:phage major capsid protein [Clostridia bacterium]